MKTNTNIRNPHRLITLTNPTISHDGKHVAIEIHAENTDPLDIEIPLTEISTVVEFLVGISRYVQQDTPPPSTKTPENLDVSPIQVNGLGFAVGQTPDEILLIVRLCGFDLAFALDSSKVAQFGTDFARTALALSANNQMPQ